jgi:hypothetical protein
VVSADIKNTIKKVTLRQPQHDDFCLVVSTSKKENPVKPPLQ